MAHAGRHSVCIFHNVYIFLMHPPQVQEYAANALIMP